MQRGALHKDRRPVPPSPRAAAERAVVALRGLANRCDSWDGNTVHNVTLWITAEDARAIAAIADQLEAAFSGAFWPNLSLRLEGRK